MKERQERIEQLLARYYAAQTTDDEQRELHRLLGEEKPTDAAGHEAQILFDGLSALAGERMPQGEGKVIPLRRYGLRRLTLWTMSAAAVLTVGVLLGVKCLRRPYCYIDGVAVYDKSAAMQTVAYLDGFAGFCNPDELVDELITNK